MKNILKIAHRGYSEKYPENTMPAFEKAIDAGADMIELDIHLSKDGKLVVIHDNHIDRTSDGSGQVKDLTLKELLSFNYNYNNREPGFVKIPTLEEVIDKAIGKVQLNIEIKNCPYRYNGIESELIGLLKHKDFSKDAIISSFDHYSLLELKKIDPEIKIGLLYDSVWLKFEDEIEELNPFSIHPGIDVVDPDQLKWAKEKGLMVYTWVAKDQTTIDRLKRIDYIDGIMVNDLELF